MTIFIRFEPHNESGVVAVGTNLLDAARRLGVPIPAECRGLGECDSCVVIVGEGADLLSPPTREELVRLGQERLGVHQRLACQTSVERCGEVILISPPSMEHEETVEEKARKFREEFRELPLKRKIARLAEFEAVSAFEAITEIASLPFTVGEKVLDKIAEFGRKKQGAQQKKESELPSDGVDGEVG